MGVNSTITPWGNVQALTASQLSKTNKAKKKGRRRFLFFGPRKQVEAVPEQNDRTGCE